MTLRSISRLFITMLVSERGRSVQLRRRSKASHRLSKSMVTNAE